MIYLLSEIGTQVLESYCGTDTLFAFDYDGTLSPIVEDPNQATMRARTFGLFRELSVLVPTAVISGRARSDVERFLPSTIDLVVGNHGVEWPGRASSVLDLAEISCRYWLNALSRDLKSDGVTVEDKKYSLAVHYQVSQDKETALDRILQCVRSLNPAPRIVLGKRVVNLLSAGAHHKGNALMDIMTETGCKSAVYFGDDDNDEDVFRLEEETVLTIRVGNSCHTRAKYYLNSQEEIDDVIHILLTVLMKNGKSSWET